MQFILRLIAHPEALLSQQWQVTHHGNIVTSSRLRMHMNRTWSQLRAVEKRSQKAHHGRRCSNIATVRSPVAFTESFRPTPYRFHCHAFVPMNTRTIERFGSNSLIVLCNCLLVTAETI